MRCVVKCPKGKVRVGSLEIGEDPVVCEETPAILHYLSYGWLIRASIAGSVPVMEKAVVGDSGAPVIRKRKGGN